MTTSSFTPGMFLALLPELGILALGLVIFFVDLFVPKEKRENLGWFVSLGLLGVMAASLIFGRPGSEPVLVWGGMLRFDWLGFVFQMAFLFAAAITALFAMDLDKIGKMGEFYLLMLASTLGMCLMAASYDLVMLYLAIETTSIPLYILAGFFKQNDKSTEAGLKYLLFGAMTSAVLLYGFSLIFGFAGTTSLGNIAAAFDQQKLPLVLVLGSLALVLVGFGFKISAFPLHFWAPDVYEGAPTPIAGFLSTASKAAGFSVLLRFMLTVFPMYGQQWIYILMTLSIATMTVGNLLAIVQKNIKRLLAYSSIAHAGYALIGLVAATTLGTTSTVLYLIIYLITNLAAFGVVTIFSRVSGSEEIAAYAGLSRRSPGLAIMMLVAFLSLAGMPPFGGFIIKFAVFAAAVQQGLIGLAVLGVLNSIVGLYYYLTVLKVVYLYRSEDEEKPLPISRPALTAMVVLVVGIILVGIIFAPGYGIASQAAMALATP